VAPEEEDEEVTADKDGEPVGDMTVPFLSLRTSSTRNSTMRGRKDDGEAEVVAADDDDEEEAGKPGVGAVEVECPEMVEENEVDTEAGGADREVASPGLTCCCCCVWRW